MLMLLGEEPRNGYQLMQAIEERSGGDWRPSPGSVYPALAQLEDEGLVRAIESDSGRVFEITDAGREHLAGRAEQAPPWEADDSEGAASLRDLKGLVIGIGRAAWQVGHDGDERQLKQMLEILAETRRKLYAILAEEPGE